jgi:acyl-CoA thioester hydrolase
LLIETSIAYLKKASIRFDYKVYKKVNKTLIAEGYTVHAFVNREGKIKRVPREVAEKVKELIDSSHFKK